MSGWIAGNLPDLRARERFLCMAASAAPDLDGLGILFSPDLYWEWHHVACHNLLFGLVLSGILARPSVRPWRVFGIYLACFHLHLVMDFWGSGPGWVIYYFWPFSRMWFGTSHSWYLNSWQNMVAGSACVAWTLKIALKQGRTPMEWVAPRWDAKVMEGIRRLRGRIVRA